MMEGLLRPRPEGLPPHHFSPYLSTKSWVFTSFRTVLLQVLLEAQVGEAVFLLAVAHENAASIPDIFEQTL